MLIFLWLIELLKRYKMVSKYRGKNLGHGYFVLRILVEIGVLQGI
jgi:hypothetical protein